MAKSMRSKREKRLRAIRREIVEPFYHKKEAAKLAAQEAALAAPKLPVVRTNPNTSAPPPPAAMDTTVITASEPITTTDVEMVDGSQNRGSLKPTGGIGKKLKRKFKVGKGKRCGKGKFRGKRNI